MKAHIASHSRPSDPSRQFLPAKVRVFIDFLAELYGPVPLGTVGHQLGRVGHADGPTHNLTRIALTGVLSCPLLGNHSLRPFSGVEHTLHRHPWRHHPGSQSMPSSMPPTPACSAAAVWMGLIHRAAGPELVAECRTLNGCKTGQAKITRGYRLSAATCDPYGRPGLEWRPARERSDLLASCYRNSLGHCEGSQPQVYRLPGHLHRRLSFPHRVRRRRSRHALSSPRASAAICDEIVFCCFGDEMAALYDRLLPGSAEGIAAGCVC